MKPAWLLLALAASLSGAPGASAQVITAQYDNARTGANRHETRLTPDNVNARQFGRLCALPVQGDVYAQPLFLPHVALPGGARADLLFVATEDDRVYAFDVGRPDPAPLWSVALADSLHGATPVPFRELSCPFINPRVGISATPVIDTTTGTIYVLARTKEAPARPTGPARFVQRLHALDVRTGAERRGSSVEITASVAGRGSGSLRGRVDFDPRYENPRAALLLTDGRVYLAWASSCDVGPYHGWVMAYDARTLAQVAVFNGSPDGSQAGIWQGQAGLAADPAGDVFTATGNGTFTAGDPGGRDYGDSLLRLALTGSSLAVADFFTPHDQAQLNDEDLDLGSGGPLLLPERAGARPRLALVGGKGAVLYVVDRDRMGRFNPTSDAHAVQTLTVGGMLFGGMAAWHGHVYVFASNDVLRDYRVQSGDPALRLAGQGKVTFTDPGATPTVSANGDSAGIVWVIESKGWRSADQAAVLHAFDAGDVSRELYSSARNAARDRAGAALRFTIPTVIDGRVYVSARGEIDVYGLIDAGPPRR